MPVVLRVERTKKKKEVTTYQTRSRRWVPHDLRSERHNRPKITITPFARINPRPTCFAGVHIPLKGAVRPSEDEGLMSNASRLDSNLLFCAQRRLKHNKSGSV
eukprot:scaffold1828_cov169-Amphora_coffeaeformis.AAC.15